jgi:gliding motility-associated-like protein
VIEKDNIQELFSKAFENQTSAVRPELWAGVQAKMAAAGVASTAAVASKGLSALTKWIIGSAAVGTVGVATVVALNSGGESNEKTNSPKEISQNMTVNSPEENKAEQSLNKENTYSAKPESVMNSNEPLEAIQQEANPSAKEFKEDPISAEKENQSSETLRQDKGKTEEKVTSTDNSKKESVEKTDSKKTTLVDKKEDKKEIPAVKHPEDTKEPVFVKLEAKVTKFPSIFTPNGDGSNDVYFVKAENINDFQLLIIDQNNREMFRSNTPGEQEGWNGRDKSGDEAPSGSYAAIVTGKDQNGKNFRDIQLFELRR